MRRMPAATEELLLALRKSLGDLESLRMVDQNDPDIVELKQSIRRKIEEIEGRQQPPAMAAD